MLNKSKEHMNTATSWGNPVSDSRLGVILGAGVNFCLCCLIYASCWA